MSDEFDDEFGPPEDDEEPLESPVAKFRREVLGMRVRHFTLEEAQFAAECLLALPVAERAGKTAELYADHPETISSVLEILREQWEKAPAKVREDAEELYRNLEKVPHRVKGQWRAGLFLFDEREYFLGESALIAGTTCRFLSRREEARQWFRLSEVWFLMAAAPEANIIRLRYQRLALMTEERRFEEVLEILPKLIASCEQLEMVTELLKCRILHGNILKEQGRLSEAVEVFREVCEQALENRKEGLLASGYVNLAQLYADLGEPEQALEASREAIPLLRGQGNRILVGKVQIGLALLYRSQGNPVAAIEAFRAAQMEFEDIQMHADVAAIHLVVADLLLEAGQDAEARREIEAALPVIEEYRLVPEGVAAFSLLRQSLRNHRINREALRELHGYFEELAS